MIRLAEESKELTGFATRGGTYQWKRMAMGLKNSPATFQRLMDDLLKEFSDFCQPYIDDVIIFSKTFEEHLEHLDKVMTKLRDAGMIVKLPKCEFAMDQLDFLGHTVNAEGIKMQQRKTKAISKMEAPRNAKETKRFLAMAGYYRKFIRDFARKTHALSELCRQGRKWEWTDKHQAEFENMKKELTSDPVMAYPDWNRQFILTTDASINGFGAVLSQEYPEGERVIAYASKKTSDTEKRYGITQLEAAAVVWAVNLFRDPYLYGRRFRLVTDHKALLKLQTMSPENNRTLERWSMKLTEFDMEIVHRAGRNLVQADCISRCPIGAIEEVIQGTKEYVQAQQKDKFFGLIYERVLQEELMETNVEVTLDRYPLTQ